MGPVQQPSENESIKSSKPLSREERRFYERVQKEAQRAFTDLCEKFNNFIVLAENDEDIKSKANELSARWKTYCHVKKLTAPAYPMIEKYCSDVINTYEKNKVTSPIEEVVK